MAKRYLKLAVLFGLALLSVYLGYAIWQKKTSQKAIAERVAQLPTFEFTDLSGQPFGPQHLAQKPTWFLYIDTTCEFCQMEIADLERHSEQLTSIQLVLISAEETGVLQQFVQQYGFAQQPNVTVVQDRTRQCPTLFGMYSTPSSLLYDAAGRLVERFGGVVKVEKVVASLNSN
jgi:cytochrome oxidase Cu insertion factor (SCO1/SenC/PrrC family)